MKTLIAPSILAADFLNLGENISQVEQAGADWLHIDVMDGHFVPNISFGIPVVEAVRRGTKLPLDVHLMIANPELYIEKFINAGANSITIHQEATPHLHRLLTLIKELGANAGVSITPSTPILQLEDVIELVDLILIMTVNPGWGGQTFIPSSLKRIEECKKLINNSGRQIYLEVDGGIDEKTAPLVKKAGANVLVAGTSVFKANDIQKAINILRNSL